jgi:hypothetical protein
MLMSRTRTYLPDEHAPNDNPSQAVAVIASRGVGSAFYRPSDIDWFEVGLHEPSELGAIATTGVHVEVFPLEGIY